MTGRERLERVLYGGERDRLAWTTLIDEITRSVMPAEARGIGHLEFYRRIGCDVLLLGPWGLTGTVCPVAPVRVTRNGVTDECSDDGNCLTYTRECDAGCLISAFRNAHPVRYPVQTREDLRTLKRIWESTRYEEPLDGGEAIRRGRNAVGDQGLYAEALDGSPIQQLIQTEMGHAGFYYLLADYRREMEALLDVMHARRLAEYEIMAKHTAADVVIPMENTSTLLTSPAIYERYCLPHLRDYVDAVHRYGHKAVLHMCGHLKALLPLIRRTGLDGINGLTPPPVGDTTFEDVLDAFGEDFVILGGVFPPDIFHRATLSYPELSGALEVLLTPRIRRSRFLLWIGTDGLPTELARLEMVQRWIIERGAL
jgi:uroporphyrinogen-III decarboxylase